MRPICLLVFLAAGSIAVAQPPGARVGRTPLDGVETLMTQGRYGEALARADAAERAATAAGDPAILARAELTRGAVWQARGFARTAVPHIQRALDIAQHTRARPLVAAAYGALAAAYSDLGQWDRVLDFAERQHEAEAAPTAAAEFRYQIQRGVAFVEFHDRERAWSSLRAALAAARTTQDDRSISTALGELAVVTLDFDHDVSGALSVYDEALDIARRAGLHDLEATWLLDSGAALRERGDFAGARLRFERALAVERAHGMHRVTPAALKNLAQVLLHDRQPSRARAALRAAHRAADEQNLPQLRWEVRIEEAALARDQSPATAARLFDEALDILEEAQGGVLVEQLRTGALTRALTSVDPYDLAIDFLLDRGETAKAFFVAERGRARAFLSTLRSAADEIARALPSEYVEAEASLLADISEGQAALRVARLSSEDQRALADAIRDDEERLSTLRLRLAADRPAVSAARYPRLWHAEDLAARLLQSNQALMMFFLGARQSTCWIVQPTGVRVVRLPPQAEIEIATREYLESVRLPGAPKESALAAALFRMLFPDLTTASAVQDLIIIPDGILHDLPFEALLDASGRRAIERFTIAYAPSASSFALIATRPRAARRSATLLAIGNPQMTGRTPAPTRDVGIEHLSLLKALPYTGVELHAIAALYGRSARLLEGAAATERALRGAELASVSILHFATHGLIDEEQPERSGLVLTAQPPADDGVLQMREVYGLRLHDALVTLSACDTALGANVRGEGIVGLSRAFFYAGADAVVASLWSVNDQSTATLMTDLYGGLSEGLGTAAALRRAKLRFLREGGAFRDPYYWAAFIVTGNGSWHDAPPVRRASAIWAYAVVIALAAAVLIWRSRRSATFSRRR